MGLKFPKPHYHTEFTFNYILHEKYETQLFQSQIKGPLYWHHPQHMCPAVKSVQMSQNLSYSVPSCKKSTDATELELLCAQL